MACVHIYHHYVETVDYTELFHFHIEFESIEPGLQCTITQTDGEKEILLGRIISKEYDMDESFQFAYNLMNNEDYCMDIWNKHCVNSDLNNKTDVIH